MDGRPLPLLALVRLLSYFVITDSVESGPRVHRPKALLVYPISRRYNPIKIFVLRFNIGKTRSLFNVRYYQHWRDLKTFLMVAMSRFKINVSCVLVFHILVSKSTSTSKSISAPEPKTSLKRFSFFLTCRNIFKNSFLALIRRKKCSNFSLLILEDLLNIFKLIRIGIIAF